MIIKYYHLAKDEELPEEFCAVRDVGGEPSEYTFYVPESEVTKLLELAADTLETKMCNADETDTWECVILGSHGKTLTVHVMECSACGHTYEHVNGDYEFCPRCGKKRVGE